MNKEKKEEAIALAICRAQIASNGGKSSRILSKKAPEGCPQRNWNIARNDFIAGYDHKDEQIQKAINLILSAHSDTEFNFHVTESGITRSLIYFWFRYEGRRYQISFHSYSDMFDKYITDRSEKYGTRWDEKSSQKTAELLGSLIDFPVPDK